MNHETWKAIKYLRGHESDVQDLAWSKDNQYLASCGVDGFVIIWSGSTFGKEVILRDQNTSIDPLFLIKNKSRKSINTVVL